MPAPRAAAIHDLSGFGRCSLTIVIPTLSAMGVQCCPLPTAYLSTHTGGFTGNTFLDLTDQMAPVAAHWRGCQLTFDAIYTGFMSSEKQMTLTADFIRTFRRPECLAVIDPVMGDHGRPYRTYTPAMCQAMKALTEWADVITPNRTEAAILLDMDYNALRLDSPADCRRWAEALSRNGRRSVVLTGAALPPKDPDRPATGAVCFDRVSGRTEIISAPLAPGQFHGTGDLFASVLTGALVQGMTLAESAQLAADFTSLCAFHTGKQNLPAREGIDFEPLLRQLWVLQSKVKTIDE